MKSKNKDLDQLKQKKPLFKKWWFWLIVVVVVIAFSSMGGDDKSKTKETAPKTAEKSVKVKVVDFSKMARADVEKWCQDNKMNYKLVDDYSDSVAEGGYVSQSVKADTSVKQGSSLTITYSKGKKPSIEYLNALHKAKSYSDNMHMSKKGIYKQLTSEYGEQFPADAAQYAIDHVKADWNANALEKAKTYQSDMNMSKKAIYDQLVSAYGEQFEPAEAQYAVVHLSE